MSEKKQQNEKIAQAAIKNCGASAFTCARMINENYDEARAGVARAYDTTTEEYGQSDTYAVRLDCAWLIVETRRSW